jgi:nucleotide-binding universal stress UspA family protein
MLKLILMPTDGSLESARPLPLAAQVAAAHDAELRILQVIEPFGPLGAVPGDEWAGSAEALNQIGDALQQQAQRQVDALVADARGMGARATGVVLEGNAAATLLDYTGSAQADLLVMATHGRSGLTRFALGSITDRLVREGTTPVLVTRQGQEVSGQLQRALVMLDGSGLAEAALPLALTLAGKPLAHVTLFRVVADSADRAPATTYLEGVAARFASHGVQTALVVEVGDPRPTVERAAHAVDLVLLCTHGRSGFDRLRHGSVADYVIHTVETPTLLVRAQV